MTASDVDLNLLRVLDALLDEGSVAGAAARLHLSAPAVSRALGRLRRSMNDPLFVRSGRGLTPTPLAIELQSDVRQALQDATRVLTPPPDAFDPAQLQRVFAISAGDVIVAALGQRLVAALHVEAPRVQVSFLPDTNEAEMLRTGQADLDLGSAAGLGKETDHQVLFEDRFVAAVRSEHPVLKSPLTLARFAQADHIVVSSKGNRLSAVDELLADRGLERVAVTVVPSFLAAAHIVAESDSVCIMPSSAVQALSQRLPIAGCEVPLQLPLLPVSQSWHRRNSADPAHRWLRDQVRQVARSSRADANNDTPS